MFCVLLYISATLTGVILIGILIMGASMLVFVIVMEKIGKDI